MCRVRFCTSWSLTNLPGTASSQLAEQCLIRAFWQRSLRSELAGGYSLGIVPASETRSHPTPVTISNAHRETAAFGSSLEALANGDARHLRYDERGTGTILRFYIFDQMRVRGTAGVYYKYPRLEVSVRLYGMM